MNALLAVPVITPLLGAAIAMILWAHPRWQRLVSMVVLVAVLIDAVLLLIRVDRDGHVVSQAGGWAAPFGITLIADRLSAIMLVVAAGIFLTVMVYAVGQPSVAREHPAFHPLYLLVGAGVALAFVTGDLFNLFVSFEVMLGASYGLITIGGEGERVRNGMTYVVISLLASIMLLTSVGLIYAATGTVNLAQLSLRIAELPGGVQGAFAVLLLLVFGVKAGLFPLFFWLPDSYPTAPSPITALFAGLLTKVGVYAIIRSQTLLFPVEHRPVVLLLTLGSLTMVIGVFGAIAQGDVKRILSFHIISQVGYMIVGLGFFTVSALAATVLFVIHNIVTKTTLLLTSGLIEHAGGSSRLSRLGGLQRTAPVVAVLFLIPALSMAGVPPLSGFVAKLGLVQSGFAVQQWWVVAISLAVSLLTLFSMSKIWAGSFWGEPDETPERAPVMALGRLGGPPLMIASTATLVVAGLAIAALAGPLYGLCERAAADLLEPSSYVKAVLG